MVIGLGFFGIILLRLINILFLGGRTRKVVAGLTIIASVAAQALFFAFSPTVFSGLLMIINLFLVINDLRLIEQRINPEYLRTAALRTWLWLYAYMGLTIVGLYTWNTSDYSLKNSLRIYDYIALLCAMIIAVVAAINIRRTRLHMSDKHYSDTELPTLTVAIPARNETDALRNCLTKLIQNDYPKLEILVLDDCSQDETAQIIKSFAHDGVRFIEGTPPPDEHWLPKNWAYEQLVEQASGEFMVFMGVDVDVHPASLRNLITFMLSSDKKMISLMPRRIELSPGSAFVQTMRYWWELVLPRGLLKRPPVLSTAWAIRRKDLQDLGGFKADSRSVIPERYFARSLGKQYAFYRTNKEIGLQTNKQLPEQIRTAIRTRYPQVHKRPEYILPLSLAIFALWVGPFVRLIGGGNIILPAITCLLLVTVHFAITLLTNKKIWWLSLISFPVVVLIEVALIYISMYEYEFSEVEWKGRNVCLPVMHMGNHLPDLPLEVPTK